MKTSGLKIAALFLLILGLLSFPALAGATIHNLAADFSTTSNPFEGWAFYRGTDLMNYYGTWSGDAISAWQRTGNFLPVWSNSPLSLLDVQAGEVYTHGDYSGSPLSRVVWTSDVTGTVHVSGSVWSPRQNPTLNRTMSWNLYVNDDLLDSGTLNSSNNRDNRDYFDTGVLAIQAGQTVVMTFPAVSYSTSDYVAVDLTIDAVPLPATVLLLGSGLLGLAGYKRRSKR